MSSLWYDILLCIYYNYLFDQYLLRSRVEAYLCDARLCKRTWRNSQTWIIQFIQINNKIKQIYYETCFPASKLAQVIVLPCKTLYRCVLVLKLNRVNDPLHYDFRDKLVTFWFNFSSTNTRFLWFRRILRVVS